MYEKPSPISPPNGLTDREKLAWLLGVCDFTLTGLRDGVIITRAREVAIVLIFNQKQAIEEVLARDDEDAWIADEVQQILRENGMIGGS